MNQLLKLTLILLLIAFTSSCSSLKGVLSSTSGIQTKNPLKTETDVKIEALLMSGTWKYQSQGEDCDDTIWRQSFHFNRFYHSIGSACQVPDAFSVDAESWHVKNQFLYIVNLSPNEADDIILKYDIDYLDAAKLVLISNGYKYTFLK